MTKFKYTKGSEKDFEGAPKEALVKVRHKCGSVVFAKEFKLGAVYWGAFDDEIAGKMEGYYEFGEVIASREPIAEPVPAADGWTEWNGKINPSMRAVYGFVNVRFRNGMESKGDSTMFYWHHTGCEGDIIAYRLSKPAQQATPTWNGAGLPPVGCECEWRDEHGKYNPGKIVYSSEWVIVFRDWCLDVEIALDSKFNQEGCVFRPIRSPEEIEREKAINEIADIIGDGVYYYRQIAEEIYDAGYRKVK